MLVIYKFLFLFKFDGIVMLFLILVLWILFGILFMLYGV